MENQEQKSAFAFKPTYKSEGYYEITGTETGQIRFHFTKKPNLINRLFCKWCLGWTWYDEKN